MTMKPQYSDLIVEAVHPTNRAPSVVEYAYDHRGRMVRKTIAPTNAPPDKALAHVWDDYNIIQETLTTNHWSLVTHNIWGLDLDDTMQGCGGVGGLLAAVKDGEVFTPTYDANGNISEYVATNGAVVAHQEYDPFGNSVVAIGDDVNFTHWFSTKPWCGVTGMVEYQFRKYKSGIGRWMSRDLESRLIVLNDYLFVRNQQMLFIDYLGGEEVQYTYTDDTSRPLIEKYMIWEPTVFLPQEDMDKISQGVFKGHTMGFTDVQPVGSQVFGSLAEPEGCSYCMPDGQIKQGCKFLWNFPRVHVTLKLPLNINVNQIIENSSRSYYQHEIQHVMIQKKALEDFHNLIDVLVGTCVPKECYQHLRRYSQNRIWQYHADVFAKDAALHVEDYPIKQIPVWKSQSEEWAKSAMEHRINAEKDLKKIQPMYGEE